MSEKKKNGIKIFKITLSTVRKSMNKFSINLFRLNLNMLIDLASEYDSNSVFKVIVEWQAKLLVLKHMAHPVNHGFVVL